MGVHIIILKIHQYIYIVFPCTHMYSLHVNLCRHMSQAVLLQVMCGLVKNSRHKVSMSHG